ncbi:unnamed protein product [Phytophthora fragariaefolia]|uniref:Unnamed protein product n=1 Tax=Phytophthora fragariaefolia TaxID=1490495 RepID=A0A9W6WJE4_9STRA|nr:unnamed protein product [Phytophthora fragariaefolia]
MQPAGTDLAGGAGDDGFIEAQDPDDSWQKARTMENEPRSCDRTTTWGVLGLQELDGWSSESKYVPRQKVSDPALDFKSWMGGQANRSMFRDRSLSSKPKDATIAVMPSFIAWTRHTFGVTAFFLLSGDTKKVSSSEDASASAKTAPPTPALQANALVSLPKFSAFSWPSLPVL